MIIQIVLCKNNHEVYFHLLVFQLEQLPGYECLWHASSLLKAGLRRCSMAVCWSVVNSRQVFTRL